MQTTEEVKTSKHTHYPAPEAPLAEGATPTEKEAYERTIALHQASKQIITVKEGKDTKVLTPIAAAYRNGVAMPLYETDIARARPGSDKEGITYPAPHVEWAKQNTAKFLQFIGDTLLYRWGTSKVKQIAQSLAEEACDDLVGEDGQKVYYLVKGKPNKDDPKPDWTTFDMSKFIPLFEELSPRAETLAEINEAILRLVDDLASLDINTFVKNANGDAMRGIAEFNAAADSVKREIMSYKEAKDKKKRHNTVSLADGGDSGEQESSGQSQAA